MPSSKSAPENDIPIARVAVSDSGVEAKFEALVDQLRGDQLLVIDHDPKERLEILPGRLDRELAQPLDTLGGIGGEQVDAQPARAHQHQLTGLVRVVQCEPDRGAAAQRIAHQRNTFQTPVVEQPLQRSGGVVVELPVLGAFVGVTVAGLVDGQHVKVLRQHRNVAGEVRPARRPRSAAVQRTIVCSLPTPAS